MDLFTHVYAEPTGQLREQREQLRAELEAEAGTEPDGGTHR
jgi:pyruvate dehydrogenase E1 component alpha subunit